MYGSSIEHRLLELKHAQASFAGIAGQSYGVGGGAAHHEAASRIHETLIRRLEGPVEDDEAAPDADARMLARRHRDELASDRMTYRRLLREIGTHAHGIVDLVTDPRDWSGCGWNWFSARLSEPGSPLCLAGLAIGSAPVIEHWRGRHVERVNTMPGFDVLRRHLLEVGLANPLAEHVPVFDDALASALEVWSPIRIRIGRFLGIDAPAPAPQRTGTDG